MADDGDDIIILSELSDDELVPQMHDDLYDGLRDEASTLSVRMGYDETKRGAA